MTEHEAEIHSMVARETAAWDARDAGALVDIFHPDMVWAWPPDARSHDPATWITPLGRYDRARWQAGWEELFRTHELVHNRRTTVRVFMSDQDDAGFAVVDVDTLWRHRESGDLFHWKGRACKGYTKTPGGWRLIFHSGLLEYPPQADPA